MTELKNYNKQTKHINYVYVWTYIALMSFSNSAFTVIALINMITCCM